MRNVHLGGKMTPIVIDKLFTTVLDLKYEIIGIKFLNTEEEFQEEEAAEVNQAVRYCVMVKSASMGHAIKIRNNQFRCNGSGTSFGYWKTDEEYLSGRRPFKTGLHESVERSKDVVNNMYRLEGENYGMVIKPLRLFNDMPDSILIVTNPYSAMRISQGYTYKYGLKKDFNIAGNQAVCYEATVVPLVEEDMNISMLCAGTRHAAGWDDTDLIVGISGQKVEAILEGIIKTINTVEPDDKKKLIIEKNGSNKILDTIVTLESAYFYSGTFVTNKKQ